MTAMTWSPYLPPFSCLLKGLVMIDSLGILLPSVLTNVYIDLYRAYIYIHGATEQVCTI